MRNSSLEQSGDSVHIRGKTNCIVAGCGRHQVFNGFDGLDAAAGAGGRAVERCSGAGEVKLAIEGPALVETVDKTGVEDVSGPSCIDDRNAIGPAVEMVVSIPGKHAVRAEGGGGEQATETGLHVAESSLDVGTAHQAAGEISAYDEIVDVGDYGDGGGAGPLGGLGGGGCVEAVNMERAGVDDPLAAKVGGLENKAFVQSVDYGSLAAGIDQDQRLRACSSRHGDELRFYAFAGEGLAMQPGAVVVAELAHVAGAHSPVLAGNDGAGGLTTGHDGRVTALDFGAARGEGFERDQGVCGVEPNAYQVNHRGLGHMGI